MQLRKYQIDSISELQRGFKKNKRQILCLPTGSGKTIIFSKMVAMAAEKGTTTLVLTHRTELFEQTFRAIEKHGIKIQRIEAKTKKLDSCALVSVAMVETIERRIKKGFEMLPKLIIIDEAHFGNFTKIIDSFPDTFVIGATATPIGKHFYNYYSNIVETIRLSDLIKQGFLCDYKGYQMQDDFSDVKKSKGEFDEGSLFLHFDKPELYNGVVDKYQQHTPGRKAIVFNCNIEHSAKTTQAFISAGIESYSITSQTHPNERANILSRFHNGEFLVLNNCGVLTTGYDEPSIEVIIVNRATMSLPLWLQMCGRGSRIYSNKNYFTVLDFGKNHDRHGMWSEDREWKLEKPKEKGEQKAPPTKECPECEAMVAASTRICKWCGYEWLKDKESEIKDGILVEVKKRTYIGKKLSECSVRELIELEKSKTYNTTFIWRVLRSRGFKALREYQEIKGYNHFWVDRQLKDVNTTFKDYTIRE